MKGQILTAVDANADMSSYMEEIYRQLDFGALNEFMQGHMRSRVTFESLVDVVMTEGIEGLSAERVCTFVFDLVFYELSMARPLFVKMLVFALLFSIVNRLLVTKNKYITDMSFLLVYATLMGLLMQSFFVVREIALEGIDTLLAFLNALIPTYALTLVISGNSVSGAMLYEVAFLVVYLVELLMKFFLSPAIHLFVLVLFMNHLFSEDKLSKLAELMESGIQLCLKSAFAAVLGLSVVQSVLTPAKDRLASQTVLSGLSAIPGVGNALGSASEVLLSCGMLIKGCVGTVGLLVLVIMAVIPLLKIGCLSLMYHLISILLQPVADPRITECVAGVARGCGLYCKMVIYTLMLFFVLFSIVSAASTFIY